MTTTTATETTEHITCPRCAGFPRAFANFPHINSGLCLLCNGRLVVVARESRPARPSAPVADERFSARKPVTLPTFGACEIARWSSQGSSEFALVTPDGAVTAFGVTNGRVWLDLVCNGHAGAFGGDRQALRTELQAALKR